MSAADSASNVTAGAAEAENHIKGTGTTHGRLAYAKQCLKTAAWLAEKEELQGPENDRQGNASPTGGSSESLSDGSR